MHLIISQYVVPDSDFIDQSGEGLYLTTKDQSFHIASDRASRFGDESFRGK